MTISMKVIDTDLEITLKRTLPLAVGQTTLDSAAHLFWDRGFGEHGEGVVYADLTNQQKLDILEAYWVRVTLDAAKGYNIDSASREATAEAGLIEVNI